MLIESLQNRGQYALLHAGQGIGHGGHGSHDGHDGPDVDLEDISEREVSQIVLVFSVFWLG
jgi:hypothetical protein